MKTTSKKNKKTTTLKYFFNESFEKINKAYDLLFNKTLNNKEKEPITKIYSGNDDLLIKNMPKIINRNRFNILHGYYGSDVFHSIGGKGGSLNDLLTEMNFKSLNDFLIWYKSLSLEEIENGKKDWCSGNCCQSNLSKLLELANEFVSLNIDNAEQFSSLYDYYNIQFPKDLEIFKNACTTDNHTKEPNDKLFFVKDLENLKKTKHYLLKKKHFMYLMVIHSSFLMIVHKHFNDKYEKFRLMNKGVVFEYGLTNTFMYPWNVLNRLHISFDKDLFGDCLNQVISQMMTDYYFCDIIPRDFMDKFIDDPDLNSPRTIYGKEWREIALEEWFQATRCICPKVK